jgi:hypothetical protein
MTLCGVVWSVGTVFSCRQTHPSPQSVEFKMSERERERLRDGREKGREIEKGVRERE